MLWPSSKSELNLKSPDLRGGILSCPVYFDFDTQLKLTGFERRMAVSVALTGAYRNLSFPRKRESTVSIGSWMPAFAGMTGQIGQFE